MTLEIDDIARCFEGEIPSVLVTSAADSTPNVSVHATPLGPERPSFCGDMAQVLGDIERCRDIGAHEVIVEPQFSTGADSLQAYLDVAGEVAVAIIPERARTLVHV